MFFSKLLAVDFYVRFAIVPSVLFCTLALFGRLDLFLFFSLSVSLSPPRFQYLHGEGKIVRLFGRFLVGILKPKPYKAKMLYSFCDYGLRVSMQTFAQFHFKISSL